MPDVPITGERPKVNLESLFGGFKFVWRCKPVLGAMTLDLMAVLLGAVTTLLADLRARHPGDRSRPAPVSCAARRPWARCWSRA